ncbi:hypothetical protein D3C84_964760 [compost metagenome]
MEADYRRSMSARQQGSDAQIPDRQIDLPGLAQRLMAAQCPQIDDPTLKFESPQRLYHDTDVTFHKGLYESIRSLHLALVRPSPLCAKPSPHALKK